MPIDKILRNIKSQSKIIKPTNNKVLLYSTGDYIQHYIQHPVINHNEKECEKEYVYTYINN